MEYGEENIVLGFLRRKFVRPGSQRRCPIFQDRTNTKGILGPLPVACLHKSYRSFVTIVQTGNLQWLL